MRRSFFSKLLLSNWLFLLILLLAAIGVLFLEEILHPDFRILLFSVYILFAMFGAFYISFSIAKSVTEPLTQIENKTGEINAGDFGSELSLPEIKELANLTESINLMSNRLKNQFVDLTIEKEKFNSLLQNLKEGVFAIDLHQTILFQNRGIPNFLIEANSQYRKIEDAVKDDTLLEFLKVHIKETGSEAKIEINRTDKFYTIKIYPLKSSGSTLMFIGVVRDVTEERQSHMLREQFVQNASHELKTPITSIKGYSETLESKLQLAADSIEKKFLDAIVRNTDRMIRIVEDMLTITRIENQLSIFQPEDTSVHSIISDLLPTIHGMLATKEQKLVSNVDPELRLIADRILLEHMLLNLISNASAYSEAHKEIRIDAKDRQNSVEVRVVDQGIGIDAENRSRIFERFFRVDKNRSRKEGGTGLGLSIVKHIVKLHQGDIEVMDNPEGGTIFCINLPKDSSK